MTRLRTSRRGPSGRASPGSDQDEPRHRHEFDLPGEQWTMPIDKDPADRPAHLAV